MDDESLYIEPRLVTHNRFFKRLWIGLKYAFGYKCRFGEWDEVIINEKDQKRLQKILNDQLK
jgi:hypothetical protein